MSLARKKSLSNMNRQKIANIIDRQSHTDWICTAYDWFMVLVFFYGNHRPAVHLACRHAAQSCLQAIPLRASAEADKGAEDILLPVWHRRNRAAFRRYNRPLSR